LPPSSRLTSREVPPSEQGQPDVSSRIISSTCRIVQMLFVVGLPTTIQEET
jgi:hypothetical protein